MNSTYEFTLKERPKVKMENYLGTKSWRKTLEGLKRKVGIFIGNKNIFNSNKYFQLKSPMFDDLVVCFHLPHLLAWRCWITWIQVWAILADPTCVCNSVGEIWIKKLNIYLWDCSLIMLPLNIHWRNT